MSNRRIAPASITSFVARLVPALLVFAATNVFPRLLVARR
jgi:hypothetical protein